MRFQLVDRVILPRREHGVDFGAERFLLARVGLKVLTWTKGHTAWSGVGEKKYYSPILELLPDVGAPYESKVLHEGGRLSHRLIAQYAEKIDEFFEHPVAKRINHRFTLIVT